MNVLVVGGAGYVGGAVTDLLLERKHNVRVYDALLYEEAPGAYKNIDVVIEDLANAGLASVIATLRPVLTYKTRKQRR